MGRHGLRGRRALTQSHLVGCGTSAFEPRFLANSSQSFLVGSEKVYVNLSLKAWNLLSALCGCMPVYVKPDCWCRPFPTLGSPSLCDHHCVSGLCARDICQALDITSTQFWERYIPKERV